MKWLTDFPASWSPQERATLRRQLVAVFVIVTLLNLGFYWQRSLRDVYERRNLHLLFRGWDGLAWYVWMLAAPATLLLIRRYPYDARHPLRSIAKMAAGSAAIYFVVTNTRYLLRVTPNVWHPPELDLPNNWDTYFSTQLERTPLDFLTYAGLFSASFAIDYYEKHRQRVEEVLHLQVQAAELKTELARLQLTALQGQLQPHFLFNSFNAISTLIRQNRSELAVASLAQLGDLLRSIMENVNLQHRSVGQELDFIARYLAIEQLRFGEKLRTRFDVDDPVALTGLVPNLLLQPLVENAIKHAVSRRVETSLLRLSVRRKADRLEIEIVDDGPGLKPGWREARGIGLGNTRSRLGHAYGSDFAFELVNRREGGTIARLDLPWREAPVAIEEATLAR